MRGRGAGSSRVACMFFLCTSQDANSVVTNSLVCSDCKRVTSLVASYIEFWYVRNISTAA